MYVKHEGQKFTRKVFFEKKATLVTLFSKC